jgi:hypothetical protein
LNPKFAAIFGGSFALECGMDDGAERAAGILRGEKARRKVFGAILQPM